MRRIIFNLALSLDGFIEGPNGEYDWCFTDQDYGLTDMLAGVDTILFGRKSYDTLLKYDANAYPDKQKIVFSRTLAKAPEGTELLNGNLAEHIRKIKNQPGKNIWLFGGADIASQLLDANLLDELQLSVHPVLLGSGTPIFKNLKDRKLLTLLHTKTYETGLVQLHYQLQTEAAEGKNVGVMAEKTLP